MRLPYLGGRETSGVAGFNAALDESVRLDVETFLLNVADLYAPNPDNNGSFQTIGYIVSTANPRLISLFVDVSGYIEGAAHPYGYAYAFNYDLGENRQLDLADVFAQGADYLPLLAEISVAQLAPELGDAFFSIGAEPRAENYQNWNLGRDRLILRFNAYEVGPYAAGPQLVQIPYSRLEGILRQDERLAAVRGEPRPGAPLRPN